MANRAKAAEGQQNVAPARSEFWSDPDHKAGLSYKHIFDTVEKKYGIPDNILAKMGYRESHFRPDIIRGDVTGTSGEKGIMQITPKWHPEITGQYHVPEVAIEYAGKWLRKLKQQFGSWPLAVMAYNWGPGNTKIWLTQEERSLNTIPPVTKSYLFEVFGQNVEPERYA